MCDNCFTLSRPLDHRQRLMHQLPEEERRHPVEVDAGADLDAAANLLVGSFYARYLAGETVPKTWPRRIVETLCRGITV
jgi:hypothetical protein